MKKLEVKQMEAITGGDGCDYGAGVAVGMGGMLLFASATAVWTAGASLLICAAIYGGSKLAGYGC